MTHRRVDALVLVAVDPALDEDRHLESSPAAPAASAPRSGSRARASGLLPVLEVLLLLRRVERVDRHQVHVAPQRRLADHLAPSCGRCSAPRSRRACSRSRTTGCAGSCRPGRSARAVGKRLGGVRLGVPHQGGAIAAAPEVAPMSAAAASAARINENERLIRRATVPSPGMTKRPLVRSVSIPRFYGRCQAFDRTTAR